MLKISDCFSKFTQYTSHSEVVILRCIDICDSFLHITLQKKQVEYRDNSSTLYIKSIYTSSRFLLEKEIYTLLKYINDNSNPHKIEHIEIK